MYELVEGVSCQHRRYMRRIRCDYVYSRLFGKENTSVYVKENFLVGFLITSQNSPRRSEKMRDKSQHNLFPSQNSNLVP
jgi:hypothetical protein